MDRNFDSVTYETSTRHAPRSPSFNIYNTVRRGYSNYARSIRCYAGGRSSVSTLLAEKKKGKKAIDS